MKITLKKTLTVIVLFSSFSFSFADSNNGYTTAANVYTGSSSRTWYGGGVAHVLSQWRKESGNASRPVVVKEPIEEKEAVVESSMTSEVSTTDQDSSSAESVADEIIVVPVPVEVTK